MVDPKFLKFDTMALHGGQQPDPTTGARAVPIYQTTSYVFRDSDQAASLFNLERAGHIYSRISNPTVAVLEERIASLEGGCGCVATASGQAALHLAIATLMGRRRPHRRLQIALWRQRQSFETHPPSLRHRDRASSIRATRKRSPTRSPPRPGWCSPRRSGNPGLEVLNIPEIAKVAHEHGLPLLVDNTFTSPYLSRPIEQGADIVMHSATKWLGGHGVAIGGVLVDGGGFDWDGSGKFPTLTEPYAGYDGLDYVDTYGPGAFHMRARTEGLRDFGACMSPQHAFYILQGVETLPLRMARHVSNTSAVVDYLAGHDAVAYVIHPSLESASRPCAGDGAFAQGSGLDRVVRGEGRAGCRAGGSSKGCKLASHLANVGDAKTLVIHPASTTHLQVDAEHLKAAGVGEDMIRLSVGLEDPGDIIDDLAGALKASQRS